MHCTKHFYCWSLYWMYGGTPDGCPPPFVCSPYLSHAQNLQTDNSLVKLLTGEFCICLCYYCYAEVYFMYHHMHLWNSNPSLFGLLGKNCKCRGEGETGGWAQARWIHLCVIATPGYSSVNIWMMSICSYSKVEIAFLVFQSSPHGTLTKSLQLKCTTAVSA